MAWPERRRRLHLHQQSASEDDRKAGHKGADSVGQGPRAMRPLAHERSDAKGADRGQRIAATPPQVRMRPASLLFSWFARPDGSRAGEQLDGGDVGGLHVEVGQEAVQPCGRPPVGPP